MKSNLAVLGEAPVYPELEFNEIECEPYPYACAEDLVQVSACLKNPPVSTWINSHLRRALDIAISAVILGACAIPMVLIAFAVYATSRGGAIFSQQRIGQGGRLFRIYKFRTMTVNHGRNAGIGLTKAGDVRVTSVGSVLRRFKLDELPQFWNVLRGDMSLVGPRPKLPQYEGIRNMPYRPGITGPATLVFRNEEQLLADLSTEQIERFYEQRIKFLKARIDVCYMCRANLVSDIGMLASTVYRTRRCTSQPEAEPSFAVAAEDSETS